MTPEALLGNIQTLLTVVLPVLSSVVLIGGDPGIGKSTLLLRALANLAPRVPTCYVTGEESLEQIGLPKETI